MATHDGFIAVERAAMKERADELKAQGKKGHKKADDEQAVLNKIAEMPDDDRAIAERIHVLVTTTAPDLAPRTWYGFPAYANADGKIVCFFQPSAKFGTRYSTLGFNDVAQLDDGTFWPTAFAITQLSAAIEKQITALVKKAAG